MQSIYYYSKSERGDILGREECGGGHRVFGKLVSGREVSVFKAGPGHRRSRVPGNEADGRKTRVVAT